MTTTVLCQCSLRCSWCARREDCSYQASAPLLVRLLRLSTGSTWYEWIPSDRSFGMEAKYNMSKTFLLLRSTAGCLNKDTRINFQRQCLTFCFNIIVAFYVITLTGKWWNIELSSFILCIFIFLKKGAFLDIVAKCEISRVLLLMFLEVGMFILYKKKRHCKKTIYTTISV